MTSAIASSRRPALLRASSACDFHSSAVSATAAEEMIAIIVICEIRETPSRVRPNWRKVGNTYTRAIIPVVIATPLRPNCSPSQIAGKTTAAPMAVPGDWR